ncbi:MAG: hypothetical protein ACLP6G_19250 [Terriglobales bacterium]
MSPELKQKIQITLGAAILVAGVRTAYILYERYEAAQPATTREMPLNADYYVVPKKLHPYDLQSAKELMKQPVWVKEGYRYTYYPYDHGHADFKQEAGLLLPIEKLQITDVVTDATPGAPGQRQVMAVFEKNGKSCAFPIGSMQGNDYQIYSDEMLYIQDPHELYKHWTTETWAAIEQHQAKPGMNELQADFAIGMGIPERSSDPQVKTVNYPNGGKPVSITYRDGKAAEIRNGS